MGARLQYAKVIDRVAFIAQGGRVHPGLDSHIVVADGDGGKVAAFLVLRAWTDDRGAFTEQWRIEGPEGGVLYESVPRELYLATRAHVEKLEDEVSDLVLDYPADTYQATFLLDEHEVARTNFAVRTPTEPAPPIG